MNLQDMEREADRCVSCGLCLPACPTYKKIGSEADSPRGRIALIRGALKGEIPMNERFVHHIDLCLACRACESVCPNQVGYYSLLKAVRKPIAMHSGFLERGARSALLSLLARPSILQRLGGALGAARKIIPKLDAMLPEKTAFFPEGECFHAKGREIGRVGLFLGCVARISDSPTLEASLRVLNALGYTVIVPRRQTCCGALHARYGEDQSALIERNVSAFAGIDAVVGTSSACTAELEEFLPILDISSFLTAASGWENVEFRPLEEKIAVHDPCSLRNALKAQDAPYALLRKIPGAEVIPLGGNAQCCGSAGSYFLSQPEMANALLDDKMEKIAAGAASVVATSNVGCAMSLRSRGVKVMHPVAILARQLKER